MSATARFGVRVRGEAAKTLWVSYIIQIFNVVTGLILARALGAQDRGVLADSMLWTNFALSIGNVGLSDSMTYLAGRTRSPRTLLSNGRALSIAITPILIAVALALTFYFAPAAALSPAGVYLFYVPLTLLTLLHAGFLLGIGDILHYNRVRFLVQMCLVLFTIALYAFHEVSVIHVVVVTVLAELVVCVYAARLVKTVTKVSSPGTYRGTKSSGSRSIVSYGVRSQLTSGTSFLNERGDQLVIGALLPPRQLGIYVLAVSATSPITLVGSAFGQLIFSRSSRGEAQDVPRLLVRTGIVCTLMSIAVVGLAPLILPHLVGPSFSQSYRLLPWLAAAGIALSWARLLGGQLKGLGRPGRAGLAEAAALVVTAVTLLALIRHVGIIAGAYSSLAGYSSSCLIQLYSLRRISYERPIEQLEAARSLLLDQTN